MTTRLLPFEEWSRLSETALAPLVNVSHPLRLSVLVVEDDAGAIVGCWGLLTFLHAEGLWIAPEHRTKASVARHLLRAMKQAVAERGEAVVLTGSQDPAIDRLIEHWGGTRIECQEYALEMGR